MLNLKKDKKEGNEWKKRYNKNKQNYSSLTHPYKNINSICIPNKRQ